VLSQLTAPAREVLGSEAGEAIAVAARTARDGQRAGSGPK
jgi:hypothetical protein